MFVGFLESKKSKKKKKVNKNKITVPYHSKQDLNINVIKSIEEHTNLKILKKLNKKKNKINKEEL